MTNLAFAISAGSLLSVFIFGLLACLFVPNFFKALYRKITKPIGALIVVGMAIAFMAAVTQIDLTSQVQGKLPVANGGTNLVSGTSGGVLAYTGTGVLASSGLLAANAAVVGGGAGVAPSTKSFSDLAVTGYVAGGGVAQVQTAALAPAATALVNGLTFNFLPIAANTAAAPTMALNGLTAKPITKLGTSPLVAGDLSTTAIAEMIYDGTEWQLVNPQASSGAVPNFADNEIPTGTINGATTAFTLAHTVNPAASLQCYLNGVLQRAAGADFTLVTATATFGVAPPTGDTLVCSYRF